MNHSTTPVGQSATVSSGREPLPPWLQTIYLYLVVAIMMAVRPRPSIRFVVSAFLAYVCYHSSVGCSRATATSDSLGAYSWGAAFAIVLLAVPLFLWLDDPMKWRYRNEAAAPETYPLWKRIHYALCIIWNFRSIGWSTQVDNVPPPATKSRAVFLRQAIVAWAKAVLVADLAQTYIQCQPLFELQGTPAFPTGLRGYLMSCACLFAYGSKAYANLRVRYISLAIVCVATGLPGTGDPEMWPDANGKWSDAYTVRRFWGRTWHQNVRRHLSACGKAVASALGFKKGSNASSYTQLYTAFFLSGLFHCFGDLAVGAGFGKSMPFFLANAAAITFEDAVIAVARHLGVGSHHESTAKTQGKEKEGPLRRWVRILGYAWVFVWFSYSLRLFVWWAIPFGMGKTRSNVVPFSIVQTFAPDSLWVPLRIIRFRDLPVNGLRLIECNLRLNVMKASL
ncbi:membrane bound O-acyl transferase family-domain-containing protein [Ganoderma leucocontextum]|nr:membrane bound O-acyl transferase family-domain-containing protein [Ganoderma leucocontextum]